MSASREGEAGRRPFALGSWRVEPGLDRLLRGDESVALEPRAMDLLVCLARHAGETVAKETLIEEVWKGAFVIEGVIPKTLSALRSALGDDAAAPTYILTVPRRGYRLVAPVRWIEAGEAAVGPSPESAAPARPAAVEEPPRRAWLERRRTVGWTLAGLVAAALCGWLVARGGLARPPRAVPPPPVPDSLSRLLLEARHLWGQRGLESVRRSAELMEQAVKEAPDSAEAHAWLALSTITRASYLGGTEKSCQKAAHEASVAIALAPDDPIALCAQGVLAIQRDFAPRVAVGWLERAVARDPAFVPARQFLAEALTLSAQNDRALEVIDAALVLDPLSALLHAVRGNILLRSDRPLAALEAYERVLVLEPQFTWVYRNRARPLVQLGREREAAESLYAEARLTGERPEHLATLRKAIDTEGVSGYYRWRLARIEAVLAEGFLLRPFQYAEALAGAGQVDRAMFELAKAPVCPDADTFFYGQSSAAFYRIRDDPRFRTVYARFGL
jgi:DNA-binding winged helix-turn-helix (wHTH) protein/tetratricopeptide (TPR) repeat protein